MALAALPCLLKSFLLSASRRHQFSLYSITTTLNHHRRRHFFLLNSSPHFSSLSSSINCINSTCPQSQTFPNVVKILEERGLLESITSESLRTACTDPNVSPLKVYCGFDPTAESLHLGNLLGIIVLSWFLRCGHTPVALLGGATGRVGDPSGKTLERPELDTETLEKNIASISNIIKRILGPDAVLLNNYDWWKDITLLDFLKNVGRFARIGTMIGKESVKRRLEAESGLSFTEFSYQLLQGYDFVHMFDNMGVSVQIGGSDQWGNITAGTDLIRKILHSDTAHGLTFPLLLKSDGTKFGKSEDGAIWLSPTMLSPYKFYQYFFNVPDADVVRFLKILTFLSLEEIGEIEREMGKPVYAQNMAQRRLAEEVTRYVHGEEGLKEALKATEALKPGAETKLDWKTIEGIAEGVPSFSMEFDQVLNCGIVDLSVSTGLLDSKSAARRLLKQGGLYLNNSRVDSEGRKIEVEDIVEGKVLLLSVGKKNKMIVIGLLAQLTASMTSLSQAIQSFGCHFLMLGLFNSIAYGLNSSVRRAIHERLDLLPERFKRWLPKITKVRGQQEESELASLKIQDQQ